MVIAFLFIILIVTLILKIFLFNSLVNKSSEKYLYNDVDSLPKHKVGLVLGTIKILEDGNLNLYFKYRIDAAEKVFKSKKVDYLIVSGDNSREDYNEPEDMKNSLVKRGIPEDKIFEDFAGFRTLDSIVRAKEIFGQESFIIISQEFHNQRALFIAQKKGLNCIAFNAKDINSFSSLKVKIREYLARVKVILDIYILNTEPKFYGDKIEIG